MLQALLALKKGSQLIKYSRKGKPKFWLFRISSVSYHSFLVHFNLWDVYIHAYVLLYLNFLDVCFPIFHYSNLIEKKS